jgi:hypothetical protein
MLVFVSAIWGTVNTALRSGGEPRRAAVPRFLLLFRAC